MSRKALAAALFKRAIAVVPLAAKVQTDTYGMNRLKRSDVLKDSAFNSFSSAEVSHILNMNMEIVFDVIPFICLVSC